METMTGYASKGLEMFGDERRDVPSSLGTHGHVCSQGHGTDQGDG